jgi:hypothetical protein
VGGDQCPTVLKISESASSTRSSVEAIWDHLEPHQAEAVVAAIEGAGARVVPPPSTPDMRPIEEKFSMVKGALRSARARTTEAVSAAIGSALRDVFSEEIAGWFQSRPAFPMQP